MPIPDWNSLDSVRRAHSILEAVALVFFALLVLFDVLAHFSEDKKKERLLEKIGLVFFAVAVLAELAAYPYGQRNDTLAEQVIGSLDAKAREARSSASTALAQSGEAETKSGNALGTANDAKRISGEARHEADSFEKDIVFAKKQAADAESHLADALRQATAAEKELDEYKAAQAPRTLSSEQEKILRVRLTRLKVWKITLFIETGDPEISEFAADLERVFRDAGYTVGIEHGLSFGGPGRGLTALAGKHRLGDVELLADSLFAAHLINLPLHVDEAKDDEADVLKLNIKAK